MTFSFFVDICPPLAEIDFVVISEKMNSAQPPTPPTLYVAKNWLETEINSIRNTLYLQMFNSKWPLLKNS